MRLFADQNSCGITVDFDKNWILKKAGASLDVKPFHITDVQAPLSEGGIHDYYSNGDYWWPNPVGKIKI